MDPRKTSRDCNENVKPPRGAYKRSSEDCLPVYRPTNHDKLILWVESHRCRIHMAAKSYMKGECKLLIQLKAELAGLETG
jgi:hypothetical protein